MKEQYDMTSGTPEVSIQVDTTPIKTSGAEPVDPALLKGQAEAEREALVDVDFDTVRSTCMDERERMGLLNGSTEISPRLSVPGGSDIYGLAVAELTGSIPIEVTEGDEALSLAKKKNNAVGIRSGGHVECKAAAAFTTWMQTIAENPEAIIPYMQKELKENFQNDLVVEISKNAAIALASGRYADDWNGEEALVRVLGDEAGEAIEVLAHKPHNGLKVVRQKIRGKTIDQTKLCKTSLIGEGSFDIDDPHADDIENAQTTGSDAARKKQLATHAREAIVASLASAVPNPELYQDSIFSSAA